MCRWLLWISMSKIIRWSIILSQDVVKSANIRVSITNVSNFYYRIIYPWITNKRMLLQRKDNTHGIPFIVQFVQPWITNRINLIQNKWYDNIRLERKVIVYIPSMKLGLIQCKNLRTRHHLVLRRPIFTNWTFIVFLGRKKKELE